MIRLAEVAKRFGVSDRRVRAWVKAGLPCRRRKTGKGGWPVRLFDIPTAQTWVEENAQRHLISIQKEAEAKAEIRAADRWAKSISNGQLPARLKNIRPDTIDGMIRRLRVQEKGLHGQMESEMDLKARRSIERRWMDVVEARRKAEKDRAAILTSNESYIPIEVAEQEKVRMALEVKAALLDLPRSLAPRLAGKERPAEIEALLRAELTRVLRVLSRGNDGENRKAEAQVAG